MKKDKMSNDEFDKFMFNYFKENKIVPKSLTNTINNMDFTGILKENKKVKNNIFNIRKIVASAISILTITGGVVFATQIIANRFNDSQGINIATENGYVYTEEITYDDLKDTNIEFQDLIMDDYTLDMNLLFKVDDKIDLTGLQHFKLPDAILTDNFGNVLYCVNNDILNDYWNTSTNNNLINTSSNIFIWNADKNYATVEFNLSADNMKFPLSQNINLKFNTIELEWENGKKVILKDSWETKISVPEKFQKRENIIYKAISCNNKKVYLDSIKLQTYTTGTKFEMSMYWGDYETWKNKSEQLRKENVLDGQLIKQEESYIENENGEKYYPSQNSESAGGYSFNTDGKLHKYETFNMTKFNATNKIKIVLKTINDEEIIINFEK